MTHRAATPSGAPSRESARAAAEGLVETAARPGPQRAWQAAALIAPVVALAMNGYIALGAVTPSFPFDEVTLLQYAKYFAQGGGEITPVEGAGYFPGWSILIAPLWWVTSSPSTFYAAAIWIGVAVASCRNSVSLRRESSAGGGRRLDRHEHALAHRAVGLHHE